MSITKSIKSSITFMDSGPLSKMPISALDGQLYYADDTECSYVWHSGCWNPLGKVGEEPEEEPKKIRVNRHTHCISCCAPVNIHMDICPYCGTPYEFNLVSSNMKGTVNISGLISKMAKENPEPLIKEAKFENGMFTFYLENGETMNISEEDMVNGNIDYSRVVESSSLGPDRIVLNTEYV